ncbi:Glutamate receptor [Heracleum sosnowskyi]|uniref:Glutamate receptor n=1 Tax=Heracleum sosnowskyi TaxID=360622 RepID=A0AAD8I0M6_9APIA|nr:Glutamate receptor [Heracleum sosnowskyi]
MACKLKDYMNQTSLTVFLLMIIVSCRRTAAETQAMKISAIINSSTRTGKEAKVAMDIAVRNFNTISKRDQIFLQLHDIQEIPLHEAAAVLIREEAQALVYTEPEENSIQQIAEIGNQAQVPVISFASDAIPQRFKSLQWPYLVQVSSNVTEQIQCSAAIIRSFNWRKIITVIELDSNGGDSGTSAVLSEALLGSGVEIEHRLVLPPITSIMADPQSFIHNDMKELASKNSRVFIVLKSSMSMATHLFKEAQRSGLMGIDSVWIVMDDIASLLHYLNTSAISSMGGVLGIKPYFSEKRPDFVLFKSQFMKAFQSEYSNIDNLNIGIHALRAYDSITAVSKALLQLRSGNNSGTLYNLLNTHLAEHFTGLSTNQINLHNKEQSKFSVHMLVNVVPNNYTDIGFWSPEFGFCKGLVNSSSRELIIGCGNMEVLADAVRWPGGISRVPKGWSMPSCGKKLLIGVPGRAYFEKFVKVDWNKSSSRGQPPISGYCIDIFNEVLKILGYPLHFEFRPQNCLHDELVEYVANGTYDSLVGDITILEKRSDLVDFTQPFDESGLTVLVTVKDDKSWIFLRPFTKEMWALSFALLIYTVLVVWLLERQTNPEFQGPWHDQLCLAVWFTFSIIFFAQREEGRSNYTRVVAFAWFFVVLALTTIYTASLSSQLTVTRLRPNITDIDWLRTTNAKIGCAPDSFVCRYLQDVLDFKAENIRYVSSEDKYPGEFAKSNISAAFLELPYEKAFLSRYCEDYTVPKDMKYKGDRFGGLGFVFAKGSPITFDVSKAILTLSENGVLKQLYENRFAPSSKCKASQNDLEDPESLSWKSFWGLYLFSAAISTISYILFAANRCHQLYQEGNNNADNKTQDSELDDACLSNNLVTAEPSNDDIQRTSV